MSVGPLTCAEIEAWSRLSGHDVSPFQFEALRRMSAEYAVMLREGEKSTTPRPYISDRIDATKAANNLKAAMARFKK